MYYYIVDAQRVTNREFERVQAQLYSSISEYHISGEIVRVTGVRTIKQLVETAFFHQAKTVVAVGNDDTLNDVINLVGERETTIGYIPLVATEMGSVLGIPDLAQACKYLAVRRVENLDLGVVNDKLFISRLSFGRNYQNSGFDFFGLGFANRISKDKPFEIQFKIDNSYIASSQIWSAAVVNSRNAPNKKQIGNPTDGKLDLLLLPALNKGQALLHRKAIVEGRFEEIPDASVIQFKQLEILTPSQLPVTLGSIDLTTTPAKIGIKPKSIRLIVGRNRLF